MVTSRVVDSGFILPRTTFADTDPITTAQFIITPDRSAFQIRVYTLTSAGSLQLYTKDADGTERVEGAAIACTAGAVKLQKFDYRPGTYLYGKYTPTDAAGEVEIRVEAID